MKAALIHTIALLAASGFEANTLFSNPSKKQSAKPVFTDEELEKLAILSGKEKKKYVRELQDKHLKERIFNGC